MGKPNRPQTRETITMNESTNLKYHSAALYVFAAIMLVQSLVDETEHVHFLGDIPALFFVAIVLWVLMPNPSAT